jgi:hypothetical protein
MTRRHHFHDFPSATGDPVYRVSFDCHSAAERDAVRAAGLAVVAPAAFVPALSSGPAFDSLEWAPNTIYRVTSDEGALKVEAVPESEWRQPPNCEGFAHAGEALAHAQHEAAMDGDDCTAGACLLTRGSD